MREAILDPLEERLEAFERECADQVDVDLCDFLPSADDPDYAAIAVELMRIDLERRWRSGSPKPLDEYRAAFVDVLSAPNRLSELAFEEYRCRLQAGEGTSPAEYERRFGINTDHWPQPSELETDQNKIGTLPSIDALGHESDRLVDSIQMFPKAGDDFLGFRLVEQLGQGTFGTVMLARQGDLAGRLVVLKISSSSSLEPQHLARLQHTNIVPIYSLHQDRGLQVVCMPFFGRTTMADIVRRLRSLDEPPMTGKLFEEVIRSRQSESSAPTSDEASGGTSSGTSLLESFSRLRFVEACVSMAVQIAEGLEHAHQRGILHRDIKPANVLLTDEGRPMLLDFNISDEIVVGGTACLFVGGTLPYMSPEQRRAMTTGKTIDQRSDVFSFGVLLYELLCGQLPSGLGPTDDRDTFSAAAADSDELARWQPVEPADIRRANRRIPASLASIVAKCLRPNRDDRYQSVGQVREDLQRYLDDLPLRHAADRSLVERCAKWCRRHPRTTSGSTITAVAAGLLIILSMFLVVRARQSLYYRAVANLETVSRQLPELRVVFGAKDLDTGELQAAIQRAHRLADQMYDARQSTFRSSVRSLPKSQQVEARDVVAELYYLAATGEQRQAWLQPERNAARMDEARHWNQTALTLFANHDVPLALRSLQAALLSDDASLAPEFDLDQAVAWRSHPRRVMHVQELMRLGRYTDAAEMLESLRRDQPFDFSTWFLLGNAYVGVGRFSEAEGCFTTCGSLWPDSYLSWFHRGLVRFELRQFALAEDDFNQVVSMRPDFVGALFNRALCRKAQSDYRGALSDLDRVLEIQNDRPRALLVRARVHELLGDEDLAKQDRHLALQSKPVDAAGWMARALDQADHDPQAAMDDLRQAQRLSPHNRAVQRNMAYVLGEQLGETEEAARLLSNLIRDHGHPEDQMAHAVMLARLGQRDAAIREAASALEAQRDAKLVFQMACVYALNSEQHSDDAATAIGLLAESISRDPKWFSHAVTDHDLNSLRKHRQYRSLISAAGELFRTAAAVRTSGPSPSDDRAP